MTDPAAFFLHAPASEWNHRIARRNHIGHKGETKPIRERPRPEVVLFEPQSDR